MEPRALKLKVGFFVLVTFIILVVFVFILGGHKALFTRRYNLDTSFTNTAGLNKGAAVRLSGVRIGSVKKIEFPEDPDINLIKVIMEVNEEGMRRISPDSVATIQTEGLLGDKYIEIIRGRKEPPKQIQNNMQIRGYTPPRVQALIGQSAQLIDNVTNISHSLDKIVKAFGKKENIENINNAISSLSRSAGAIEGILRAVQTRPSVLHTLIYGERDKSGKGFDENTLLRIDDAVTNLNDVILQLRKGSGVFHALIYDKNLSTDLDSTLSNLSSASSQIGGEDGAAAELRKAATNFREITEMLKGGEGTLGALLIDPTVYDQLKGLLGQADRSRFVRAAVKYMLEERAQDTKNQ
jgi:phospholipid/cholesterol/gamma-HCH transport system substrate-binding protein